MVQSKQVPARTLRLKQSEHVVQRQVIIWFSWKYPVLSGSGALFAVPNGGLRSKTEAARLRREGVFPGVSDLILLVPSGEFHGLCLEMKAADGILSKEQSDWLDARRKSGYQTLVCYGYDAAVAAITEYLEQ